MTQRYRFDRGGGAITGQAPVQVRVLGEELSRTQAAEARSLIDVFITHVRTGDLKQLRRSYRMSDGSRVDITHMFGVTTATVYPVRTSGSTKKDESSFMGGIVVKLQYRNESGVLTTLPEVQSAGIAPGKSGRPAVPGTLDTDVTTHVVVQIQPGVNLSSAPVARGYVTLRRIKDPLFGEQAEVPAQPNKYLVSADRYYEHFYLCGRALSSIPALPMSPAHTDPSFVEPVSRLAVFGFAPDSIEDTSAAGILVVAYGKKLYAYDTRNAAAGWQLLASSASTVPANYINDYGDIVSFTAAGATVTLSCSGTNGAGPRSSFTVSATPLPDGTYALAGTISPVSDNSVAEAPATYTYTVQGPITGAAFRTMVELTPFVHVLNERDLTRRYSVVGGTAEKRTDRIFGGFKFHYDAVDYSEEMHIVNNAEWLSWTIDETISPNFSRHKQFSYSEIRGGTTLLNMTYEWTIVTSTPSTLSPPDLIATGQSSRTQSLRPREYRADKHTGKMALKFTEACTQTVTTTFAQGEFDIDAPYLTPGTVTKSRSAITASRSLVRANGEVLATTPDIFARHSPAPTWTGAATDSPTTNPDFYSSIVWQFVVPEYLKYESLAGGAGELISPGLVRAAVIYNVWPWGVPHGYGPAAADALASLTPGPPDPGFPATGTSVFTRNDIDYGPASPTSLEGNDYIALFPPTTLALTPPAPGSLYIESPSPSGTREPVTTEYAYFDHPGPVGGSFLMGGDVLYDIRTGGFIARASSQNTEGATTTNEAESWLGNDVSIVPLSQIIEEWRALGTTSAVASAIVQPINDESVCLL